MQRPSVIERCRGATWKTWLGGAVVIWLLLAEAFAIGHQYDAAAHADGQACVTCVGVASFGAGNVADLVLFEPAVATTFVVVAAGILFLSAVRTCRYARGPPRVSFTF